MKLTPEQNIEVMKRCQTGPIPSIWECIFGAIAYSCFDRGLSEYGIGLIIVIAVHWVLRGAISNIAVTALVRVQESDPFAVMYPHEVEREANRVANLGMLKTTIWLLGIGLIIAPLF